MRERLADLVARVRHAVAPRDSVETTAVTGIFLFVIVLVVAGALIFLGGGGPGGGPGDGSSPSAGATLPSGVPSDPSGVWDPYLMVPGDAGAAASSEKAWGPVVREFVGDLFGASTDRRWRTKLTPLVSPQLARRLGWVVRSQVPRGTFSGMQLTASGGHAAEVTASYRSGGEKRSLSVGVVDLPDDGRGWMVYKYADAG